MAERKPELRITEQSNPATEDIDSLDSLGIVERIAAEDARIAPAVKKVRREIAAAVDKVVEAFRNGGRLFYTGAGTSGRLGVLDASECPPTFSSPPELVQGLIAGGYGALRTAVEGAEDDVAKGGADLLERGMKSGDVVVGIAASGTTPYVRGALEAARRKGAATVLVTCNPNAALAPLADITIAPVVGPEVIAGSTRMKAGTATKLVLNSITTAAMIRWGKVYGNRMVDLMPACDKLVERSERLVSDIGQVDPGEAVKLLKKAGGSVKTAIVMARTGTNKKEAEKLLKNAGGQLRGALGESGKAGKSGR